MASRSEHGATDPPNEPGDREPSVVKDYAATGVTGVMIALFLLGGLGIVVLAQNTASIPFDFLWWSVETPVFVLLLAAAAGASLVTLVAAEIWRRRRRRTRTEREELERLRRRIET